MSTTLSFTSPDDLPADTDTLVVVGHTPALIADPVRQRLPEAAQSVWTAMVEGLSTGDEGDATTTWLAGEPGLRVVAAGLPADCSRHNCPAKPHAISTLIAKHAGKGSVAVLCVLDHADHGFAAGCAVARAFPLYNHKSGPASERHVTIAQLTAEGRPGDVGLLDAAAEGIRLAGRLVDAPASELNTDAFVAEARTVAEACGADIQVIRGEALGEHGLGGLWSVGKAATHPPALVVLSHRPDGAQRKVVWVGKGIVYDTGGLSIKTKTGMPGMKTDMGGAAAVLGAFSAAVRLGVKDELAAVLCLAENSVGPLSTRPDDIIEMYSGKTVEVNNTDAEGRLVVADGVAYASRDLGAAVIVDLATLTGAQLISTGRRHAAIVCNDAQLEADAVAAGRRCGDLVHPLPYCPEFYRKEFKSKVANLKNSVKDRANAQSSCAGQFIGEHLVDFAGQWLHVDIAGPARNKERERGTGFGVALLLELFKAGR